MITMWTQRWMNLMMSAMRMRQDIILDLALGEGGMDRICPNCGRPMGEFDPLCGPGGLGCLYCTKQCPNCGKEVFDQDIIYGSDGKYCKYCAGGDAASGGFDSVDFDDAVELSNLPSEDLIKKADEVIEEAKKSLSN